MNTLLQQWVAGTHLTAIDAATLADMAKVAITTRSTLYRNSHTDPQWNRRDVVRLKATAFTSKNVLQDAEIGQCSWNYTHKAIIVIVSPKHGIDVDYQAMNAQHDAAQEAETICAGEYEVVKVERVREPFTAAHDGHTVPCYTLREVL